MLSRQANCDPSEEIGQTALWQLRQGSTLVCTALYGSDQASPRGAHVAGRPCLESCRRVGGTLVVPHAPVLSPAARGRHAICGRTQAIRSSEQAHRERGHRCWAARRLALWPSWRRAWRSSTTTRQSTNHAIAAREHSLGRQQGWRPPSSPGWFAARAVGRLKDGGAAARATGPSLRAHSPMTTLTRG